MPGLFFDREKRMLRCVFVEMNVVRRELRRFGMKIKPVLLRLPFQGQTAENRLFFDPNKTCRKESSAPIPASKDKRKRNKKAAAGRGYAEHF